MPSVVWNMGVASQMLKFSLDFQIPNIDLQKPVHLRGYICERIRENQWVSEKINYRVRVETVV